MQKKIKNALISVFYKDGLEPLLKTLEQFDIIIYSTGGTQKFIEEQGIKCKSVESLTSFPSILGGRVKTLHPLVFGGILARRTEAQDIQEMSDYNIPEIDLVIVDLYPFEETLASAQNAVFNESDDEINKTIIEKIDIGGPSMIRAAAKNFADVIVIADKKDYSALTSLLNDQHGETNLQQRKKFAARAFEVVMNYDIAISNYFNQSLFNPFHQKKVLRYGENPHQQGVFYGDINKAFTQVHGKEISYNNLVDTEEAISLINEFSEVKESVFAIIKHTNVCGIAQRPTLKESWEAALAGDTESAFGGVLVTNKNIDAETANAINEIFFEVLIAPAFDDDALHILKQKKNRILLVLNDKNSKRNVQYKSLLNGTLAQNKDEGNYTEWKETGGRTSTQTEKNDLEFANIVCKHLKSNAIALVKDMQLVGKGCGQTSRIDALRQAIEKARQFKFDLHNGVLASDAFFPFDDCVKLAHTEGIEAFIQPGGSVRDKDSIEYCVQQNLVMIITGMRHFKH